MELDRDELKSLFERAKEITKADQAAFLDRTCSDNHTLRTELESLLAADADADEFFGERAGHVLPEDVNNLANDSLDKARESIRFLLRHNSKFGHRFICASEERASTIASRRAVAASVELR